MGNSSVVAIQLLPFEASDFMTLDMSSYWKTTFFLCLVHGFMMCVTCFLTPYAACYSTSFLVALEEFFQASPWR